MVRVGRSCWRVWLKLLPQSQRDSAFSGISVRRPGISVSVGVGPML